MVFCTNCGAQITETDKFCTACGNTVSAPPSEVPQGQVITPVVHGTQYPVITSYSRIVQPPRQFPQQQPPVQLQQQINITLPPPRERIRSAWETPRMITGIITLVLFCLMQVQSCTACACESFDALVYETSGTSGSTGFFMSFFFLAAGLISLTCRRSRGAAIAAGCIYGLCGIVLSRQDFSYFADLQLYCYLSFIFGGIMILGGILQKRIPRQ